jgi:hypothetical protein
MTRTDKPYHTSNENDPLPLVLCTPVTSSDITDVMADSRPTLNNNVPWPYDDGYVDAFGFTDTQYLGFVRGCAKQSDDSGS